jgi:hypothetical protein
VLDPQLCCLLQVEFSVDIYSFGVLMWELFTSHPVYLGLNSKQIRQQVSRHPQPACYTSPSLSGTACVPAQPQTASMVHGVVAGAGVTVPGKTPDEAGVVE